MASGKRFSLLSAVQFNLRACLRFGRRCGFREILSSVIDHAIGADGADHVQVSGAAYACDVCAEGLGDLHGKCSDAASRAVDEDFAQRLIRCFAIEASQAKTLQRGECGDGYGGRLRKSDVFRLRGKFGFGGAGVLGKGSPAGTEDVVTGLELGDLAAGGFDLAGYVGAEPLVFWFAKPGHQANEIRIATHEVPIIGIDGSRSDAKQDFIVLGNGYGDIGDLQDVRRSVASVDGGFHVAFPEGAGPRPCTISEDRRRLALERLNLK